MILLVDNYDSFTYNLVAPLPGARRRGRGAAERRDRRRRGRAAAPDPSRRLPRPRAGRRTPARRSRSSGGSAPRDPRRSASASATRRSSRRSAARSARRSELVHGKATERRARRPRHLRRAAAALPGRAATTRSPRPSVPDELEVSATSRRRRGDGRPPPRAPGRRRAVPPGVGAHPARARPLPRTSSSGDPGRARPAARRPLARPRARRAR